MNFLFNTLPNRPAFRLVENILNKNTIIASTLGAGDSSLSTVSICNRNVKNLLFFYPNIGNICVNFSIITYGDEVRLCLVADSNIISQPDLITSEFIKQVID